MVEFPETLTNDEMEIYRKELELAGLYVYLHQPGWRARAWMIRDQKGMGLCAYRETDEGWVKKPALLLFR